MDKRRKTWWLLGAGAAICLAAGHAGIPGAPLPLGAGPRVARRAARHACPPRRGVKRKRAKRGCRRPFGSVVWLVLAPGNTPESLVQGVHETVGTFRSAATAC